MNIFLNLFIILFSLCLICFCNSLVKKLHDFRIIVVCFVYCRTRLKDSSCIITEDIESHTVDTGLMFTLCCTCAEACGVKLYNIDRDSDLLKLALYHLRNCLSLCSAYSNIKCCAAVRICLCQILFCFIRIVLITAAVIKSIFIPAPERGCFLSTSLCCYSDNAVNVNSICNCFSKIFIVCRGFLCIKRKVGKRSAVITDQIQIRISLDRSKLDRCRLHTDINFSVL